MADTATEPEAAAGTKADVGAQLDDIRRDIAALAKSLGAFGRSQSASWGDEARLLSQEALAELKRLLHEAQQQLGTAERKAERSVHEHPGQWLGGVLGLLGLGVLFGMIFGRRN